MASSPIATDSGPVALESAPIAVELLAVPVDEFVPHSSESIPVPSTQAAPAPCGWSIDPAVRAVALRVLLRRPVTLINLIRIVGSDRAVVSFKAVNRSI
mgnify:CR=1 FL=1